MQSAACRKIGLLFPDRTQRQKHGLKRGLGLLRGLATFDKLPQQSPLAPHALDRIGNLLDRNAEIVFEMPHEILPISIPSLGRHGS